MLLWCATYTNWWIYNNLTLKIKKEIQIKETSAGCTEVSFICQNISKVRKIFISILHIYYNSKNVKVKKNFVM